MSKNSLIKFVRRSHLVLGLQEQESAATTIQAGYRGYRDRQKVKDMKQEPEPKVHSMDMTFD